MNKELQTVIEDNLVQLRHDTAQPGAPDAGESAGRLFGNLAVLIAAGGVSNPSSLCSEVLGRVDEIHQHNGITVEVLDPGTVREEMGGHNFTYLYLHQGEVQACHEVMQSEAQAHPAVGTYPKDPKDPLCNEWPLKEVPSQPCVLLGEDLPNFKGTHANIMDLVDRMARMADSDREEFKRAGNVRKLRWNPSHDSFELEMDNGVTWTFNQWNQLPGRTYPTPRSEA